MHFCAKYQAMHHSLHSFHIPVMGLSYTIDSPVKVAHYGISSAISIMDDDLVEKMRGHYAKAYHLPYLEISTKAHDYRARRITAYLDLIDHIVSKNIAAFKEKLVNDAGVLHDFLSILPKSGIREALEACGPQSLPALLDDVLEPGSIDVNIMTKLDKDNFDKKVPLPVQFNDAHAALRGFANSSLNASVILSAGMNPRLYAYFENFPDFFPDANGALKKKVILKVSDFRSALIQGNFLAKKGIWVSEYRVESGLNCGGHAFATDGLLMGPILEEFREKKQQLMESAHTLMAKALEAKGAAVPTVPLPLKITFQGGVGTAAEHAFLLEQYELDSIGWGTPFLLVPEATTVDNATRQLLIRSNEEDLVLSNCSPLGIPFNIVKGTTNEAFLQHRIHAGKPGSSCPKKFLALHKDDTGQAICTASRKYQQQQLAALDLTAHQKDHPEYRQITEKSCLCVGLSNAALMDKNLPVKGESQGVIVCPGPNIAYFDKEITLFSMVRHIYGKENILGAKYRPHVFLNELKMYVDYFIKQSKQDVLFQTSKMEKFRDNLLKGMAYYNKLFTAHIDKLSLLQSELNTLKHLFENAVAEIMPDTTPKVNAL